MGKGIAVAGNMLVDIIYPINHYPPMGELALISDPIQKTTGGAVCNVIIDLAKMDPELPLLALGVVGDDENGNFVVETLSKYPGIQCSLIARDGTTSFTAVMNDEETKQRTFFHLSGANGLFSECHFQWDLLSVDILHVGYISLLKELDEPDEGYGTKMAKVLAIAKQKGIKTSIDLVSGQEERLKQLVPPVLPFTDYCVINELEAENTVGIPLRDARGLNHDNIPKVLSALREMGVLSWVVIHAPEGGFGLDCITGQMESLPSLKLPEGYIRGTTGAGDAFCSGVLYGAYQGMNLREALQLGIAAAACSLSEPGATEGLRTFDEVLAFYHQMKEQETI